MHVESLGATELVEAVGRTLPFDGGRKRRPREGQYQGEKTQPISCGLHRGPEFKTLLHRLFIYKL